MGIGHGKDSGGHGHSHGLVDRSISRSKDGVKTVGLALAVLAITSVLQLLVYFASGSIALLADLIHNFGDALTAIPLAIAFWMRSERAEKGAGYFVIATIFFSACVAAYQSVERLLHPQTLTHLWALTAAALIGFAGNYIAAWIRLRGGRRLDSPALEADGNHAKIDALVSLTVLASVVSTLLHVPIVDPLVGLAMTLVILRITWQSWNTVRRGHDDHDHAHDDHDHGHGAQEAGHGHSHD